MIINLINYTNNLLTVSADKFTIDSIDFISHKITISKTKEINNFLIYEAKLNISDSPKLPVSINNDKYI